MALFHENCHGHVYVLSLLILNAVYDSFFSWEKTRWHYVTKTVLSAIDSGLFISEDARFKWSVSTAFCSSPLSFVLDNPLSNVFRSESTRSATLLNSGLAWTRLLAPSSAVLFTENWIDEHFGFYVFFAFAGFRFIRRWIIKYRFK